MLGRHPLSPLWRSVPLLWSLIPRTYRGRSQGDAERPLFFSPLCAGTPPPHMQSAVTLATTLRSPARPPKNLSETRKSESVEPKALTEITDFMSWLHHDSDIDASPASTATPTQCAPISWGAPADARMIFCPSGEYRTDVGVNDVPAKEEACEREQRLAAVRRDNETHH